MPPDDVQGLAVRAICAAAALAAAAAWEAGHRVNDIHPPTGHQPDSGSR
ncbi:hypothetical protein AB0M05_35130 [Streptomyces violaceusniger]